MPDSIVLDATYWQGVDAGVEALVDAWLVQEGAAVEAGQPVVRVVLVKSTIEITAPAAGTIERITVPAGKTFAREQPLAILRRR